MSKKLIIFPFGGNGWEALDVVMAINRIKRTWNLIGFIDDDPKTWGKELCGIKVLGGREILRKALDAFVLAVVGNANNYLKRREIIDGLKIHKSRLATIIHPSASISNAAKIGYNTLLMAHTVVSCETQIGNHCIVLPNTIVSHNSTVMDYCCIGSNVSVSGYVTICENCYIGSGTSIRDHVTIGSKTLVGLGSNVISGIDSDCVVVGNPARKILL